MILYGTRGSKNGVFKRGVTPLYLKGRRAGIDINRGGEIKE